MMSKPESLTPSDAKIFVKTKLVGSNFANRKIQKQKEKTKTKMTHLTPDHFKAILTSLKNSKDAYTQLKVPHKKRPVNVINLFMLMNKIKKIVNKKRKIVH